MHPVNRYAWSKLGGECAVRLYDNSLMIRTSFGPDVFPYPKAFVDRWTSRQAVSAAARDILAVVRSGVTGGLHVGGPRRSVHEHALSLDPSQDIGPLSIKDVSLAVPVDTSLDTSRFRRDVEPVSNRPLVARRIHHAEAWPRQCRRQRHPPRPLVDLSA